MAGSLRCSICGISWPPFKQWQKCGKCGQATDGINDVPDYTISEAVLAQRGFEFEVEYAKRQAGKVGKCGQKRGPTDEQLQRLDDLQRNGRLLNQTERILRFTLRKGESDESVPERSDVGGTKI